MQTYDDVVVGSGISGLSMAQLLGQLGRRVLLLEKSSKLGGALLRFREEGIPIDTGFHFTGGFRGTESLTDMLKVLNIYEDIKPIFIQGEDSNRIIIENSQKIYKLPPKMPEVIEKLIEYFPEEEKEIKNFFQRATIICNNTPMLDIRNSIEAISSFLFGTRSDYDAITLKEYMEKHIKNTDLKALLSVYCLCYGTKPEEVSFADHCRVCLWLYSSVARVKEGGEAFINAFKREFLKNKVYVKTSTYIESFFDITEKKIRKLRLNNGEEVAFKNCIFTIHPKEIVKILPDLLIKRGFTQRVSDFEETNGFFSVYGYLDNYKEELRPSLTSILTKPHLDNILESSCQDSNGLVVMNSIEQDRNGNSYNVINAFETEFYEDVKKFDGIYRKTKFYENYKQQKQKQILDKIYYYFPHFKGKLKVLGTASSLTFKDYLHSPYGSAYGIKQKIGQFNLIGRLPIRNFYAVGQNSMLPGLVGSMMSSFIVIKSIIGKEAFKEFLDKKLN